MRYFAKLVVAGLLTALAVGAGCSSDPLPKPGATNDAAGAGGAEVTGGSNASGNGSGSGNAGGAGGAPSVELGPDGCPLGDWSEADGLPCAKEGVECTNPELTDCGGSGCYSESVTCFNGRWRWDSGQTDCG